MVQIFNKFVTFSFVLLIGMLMLFATGVSAQEADTIMAAFQEGDISGTIGSYYEFTNSDADASDFGWSSAYLTLKYETRPWNRLKFGTRLFAHGELFEDHQDSVTNPFENDVEREFTVPELYLNVGLLDDSSLTVGRWNHKKVTHLDDAQSEGAYLSVKEIENVDFVVGFMRRFAEIDYDDSEDFGRANDAQDLDNESTYGSGSKPVLAFLESEAKLLDWLKLNPYAYYHSGYAGVYGLDSNIDLESDDLGLKYGALAGYYFVAAEIMGSDNANVYAVCPYVEKGPVSLRLGFVQFDDGSALNRPAWLSEHMTFLDQIKEYGRAGSQKVSAKLKYAQDKFWSHYAYGQNNYDFTASRGDRSHEHELQVGYKFTKSFDVNVRFFDVQYDHVDNLDYHKIESHIRFKF